MSKKLLIGQITDLHARWAVHGSASHTIRRSRVMYDLLPQAIDQLKARNVDLLVITGDLVDVPTFVLDPNSYYHMPIEPWLPLVEADYRRLKALLDAAGLPYVVLPGNHDYEPVMWKVFDRTKDVIDLGLSEKGWHPISSATEETDRYRIVRFCDREWEDHLPRRFDRERQLWLDMLHDDLSPPQIHLQHYVITPPVASSYPHNYLEADELKTKTIAAGKVRLSLAGHYHRGSDLLHVDGTNFAVGPAFCEFPHPVRIYTVAPNQVTLETIPLCTQPHGAGRPVVFLDRDGVINDRPSYRTGPDAMQLIPGAAEAMLQLREAGYAIVVITNQSAVGAGYTSGRVVDMVHERMCQLLVAATGDPSVQPDAIFYSVDAGDRAVLPKWAAHDRSKPSPQMLQQATELLGLTTTGAWMVGDRQSDLEAALAFGATPILVRTGDGQQTEREIALTALRDTVVCQDLSAAVAHILYQTTGRTLHR